MWVRAPTLKDMHALSFRRALASDCAVIIELFATALGIGYVQESELHQIIERGFCYLACEGDTVVGAVSAHVTSAFSECLPLGQEYLAKEWQLQAPTGVLKAVAVDVKVRRLGVGSVLVREATEWLHAHGARSAFAAAWMRAGKAEAEHVLAAAGFQEMMVVDGFWRDESLLRAYQCPVCGCPCACAAIIMQQSLSTE
jgi:GNAT superfamily N-acetyltransferase